MRPTKLLAFGFAALAVGVAVPEVNAATTEAVVTTVHANACLKTCPAGAHCGYCGFSGRYSIECCKKDTFPGQLGKADGPTLEPAVKDAHVSTLEAAVVVARDNTETHHTCTRRCTTESCERPCQDNVNGRDRRVDQFFCRSPASCRRRQECWMRLVRNFPKYYCKNVALALETSPVVPVNGLSTRDELSALDKKILMDICFLNGATCTDLQDCWYDPMRSKQYYCVDRPFAQLEGSPVAPVDDSSAAYTYEIRVDSQYCLVFNNFGIGRQCWCPSINKQCYAHCRSSGFWIVDCQGKPPIDTLSTRDNLVPHNCPVGPQNYTPRCSESEMCYFNFKTLRELRYLCNANPVFSFIEPVPVVKLNTRGAMQTSEEVDPTKCDPRCSEGQKCYRMMFSGTVIYYCN